MTAVSSSSRRGPFLSLGLIVLATLAVVTWLSLRTSKTGPEIYTGYVTSHDLYLASPVAGTVAQIDVSRGQRVAAGQPLFRIDPTVLGAHLSEAAAQLSQSQAQLEGQQADLAAAQAGYQQAAIQADLTAGQVTKLLAAQAGGAGAVSQQEVDQARAASETARRARDAAQATVDAARAQIAAASSSVAGNRAGLTAAQRQLSELSPVAPKAARVEDLLYQAGEWVPASAPVVSLVPDDQIRVRFYVPERSISSYRPGTEVPITCDGCTSGMTARIDYVAPRPEYTPPVIYSLANRDRLVFMVEAEPSAPLSLTVGQPIDVTAIEPPRPAR